MLFALFSLRGQALFEDEGTRKLEENSPMDLDSISPASVDAELDKHGYLVIKNPEVARACTAARVEYERCLVTSVLHAPRGKFHFTELRRGPWRKLTIGSTNGIGEAYAQNLQSTYFDFEDKNYPVLGSLFKSMTLLRNKLMQIPPSFGSEPERDKFWNACRVHHYPRGGGFMSLHRDTHFPQIIDSQIGKPYYQLCVLLSRKGADFATGGGVIIDNAKSKVDLEIEAGFGSLVIFDGRAFHGVEDVDLDQIIDFSKTDGRLAAFVNLYAVI